MGPVVIDCLEDELFQETRANIYNTFLEADPSHYRLLLLLLLLLLLPSSLSLCLVFIVYS